MEEGSAGLDHGDPDRLGDLETKIRNRRIGPHVGRRYPAAMIFLSFPCPYPDMDMDMDRGRIRISIRRHRMMTGVYSSRQTAVSSRASVSSAKSE